MSEPIKTISVVVKNKTKNGYRRAGFSLQPGDNVLANITVAQFEQLKADQRLVVQEVETGEGGKGLPKSNPNNSKSGKQLSWGTLPADLTVEKLKAQLTELGVEFKANAVKAELVELLAQALKAKEEA